MKIIDEFLNQMKEKDIVIHYLQVYHQNQVIGEFQRVKQKTRLNTYSASKSIKSMAIGIAIEEGLLSLQDPIYQYFDEIDFDQLDPLIKMITIEHLLTMTSGLKEPLFFMDDEERYQTKDWIKYFFNSEFTFTPGTYFLYSNFHTYILGCIIEKVSKQTLVEYLTPRLFEPLGINSPDWLSCPKGHSTAANSLMLTIDEMTKLGILLLQNGIYQNQTIVPTVYLKEATSIKVKEHHYGYQFWIDEKHHSYRAEGKYGQFIIVVPDYQLVVTVQSFTDEFIYPMIWNQLIEPIIDDIK